MRCVECGLFAPSCRRGTVSRTAYHFSGRGAGSIRIMLCRQVWGRAVGSERIACIYCPAALGNVRRQNRHPIGSCETLLGSCEFMPYFSRAGD
jgi:hypothetical protein